MQPPIPARTILQNRYHLIRILGQGGFARTYLAEDQGRFNELCALKEFIPNQSSAYVLEKSRELFQREAAILYQIQHPQIPQFRATFEYDAVGGTRLFLVQDYVAGKTYRELLSDRKAQGLTFSEAEVRQLMQQMLPVLAHIHSKGIIHRDISPDNLILREPDHQPVLIDFGVVKEIVTRLQNPDNLPQGTMVGKLGFAPIEQLQTGRAYPSSDLYSLAVTVIVLLTGQEPQDLFDDTTVTWHWQTALGARAGVNPEFAQVLERMLANKAGDRYQSVSEVVQALQALPAAMNLPTPAVSSSAPAVASNVSQVRTMAVERPDALMPQPRKRQAVIPPLVTRTSIWDNPWAVGVIYLILALGVGAASWAVVRSLLQRQRPQFLPPVVVSSPPTPTPTPSPASVTYRKTLALAPGDQVTVQGALQPQEIQNYLIQGQQGQELSAYLAGQGILMTVLGPDQKPLNPQARQVAAWSGVLPATGNYYLQLKPIPEVSQHDYQLTVSLADLTPPTLVPIPSPPVTDSPTPTVDISPSPSIEEEQVNFPEGASSQQLSAQAIPNVVKRYLVNARAGQVLSAQVLNGAVTLSIRDPEGKLIENAGKVLTWESLLPESGNYQIDVAAINKTDFTLDIGVRDGQEQVP